MSPAGGEFARPTPARVTSLDSKKNGDSAITALVEAGGLEDTASLAAHVLLAPDDMAEFTFTGFNPPRRWADGRSPASRREEQRESTRRVVKALKASGMPALVRRAGVIEGCRSVVLVAVDWDDPSRSTAWRWRCRDRLCADCALASRTEAMLGRLPAIEKQVVAGDGVYFVTLTQPRRPLEPIAESRRRIRRAFDRLRRRRDWTGAVTGWMARFEDTWDPHDGFHSHVHVLLTTTRPAEEWLEATWARVLGGPHAIVDVEPVPITDIRNVLGYLAKPPPYEGPEVIDVARGLRAIHDHSAGGALRPAPEPRGGGPEATGQEPAGRRRRQVLDLRVVQELSLAGDRRAHVALRAIKRLAGRTAKPRPTRHHSEGRDRGLHGANGLVSETTRPAQSSGGARTKVPAGGPPCPASLEPNKLRTLPERPFRSALAPGLPSRAPRRAQRTSRHVPPRPGDGG